MKRLSIFTILIFFVNITYCQVETKYYKNKDSKKQVKFIDSQLYTNKLIELPSFDIQKEISKDSSNDRMDKPFRFGKAFDVTLSLNDGEWKDVENGRIWSMEFKSPKAYSINFVFDRLYLPDCAELYIGNSENTILYGPVTSVQNTASGLFLTDLIMGDDVTIYLFEPSSEKNKSQLNIKRVVHAYRNMFSSYNNGNLNGSESCNNDIACWPSYNSESNAVALVLLSDGTEWCSGSLIITADQSFRPYFLTAFHCLDVFLPAGSLSQAEIDRAQSWMFKFQYKKTTCNGSSATNSITYNGATFRAGWAPSDFALMEIANNPTFSSIFSFLGWDRSGNTPSSGTGIHHPAGDVMKISFTTNAFQTSSWGGTNNHWLFDYTDGVVQKGSSGSPILDQNNRVVGQLHGNQNYDQNKTFCSQPRAEYGRFDISWTGGGTNATRLSNWLDPCNTGVVTTNTLRSPYISGPTFVCSSGATFTVNNVPAGCTVSWTCSSNITFNNQTGNPKVFTANGSGAGWVQATINSTTCGSVALPQYPVWVGAPTIPVITNCPYQIPVGYLLIPYATSSGASSYFWSANYPLQIMQQTGNWAHILCRTAGNGILYTYASNNCGTSQVRSNIQVLPAKTLSLSPNPASDNVTLTVKTISDISDLTGSKLALPESLSTSISDTLSSGMPGVLTENPSISIESAFATYSVKITNTFGKLIYSTKATGDTFTIPVGNLTNGIYFVEVNDGKNVYSQQLVVSH